VKRYVAKSNPAIYAYRVTGFALARSTRTYVLVGVSIKDKGTNAENQNFVAILKKQSGKWQFVTGGSDQVGCGRMPIRYLAELGLGCDLN
jgi:hypothetical protein